MAKGIFGKTRQTAMAGNRTPAARARRTGAPFAGQRDNGVLNEGAGWDGGNGTWDGNAGPVQYGPGGRFGGQPLGISPGSYAAPAPEVLGSDVLYGGPNMTPQGPLGDTMPGPFGGGQQRGGPSSFGPMGGGIVGIAGAVRNGLGYNDIANGLINPNEIDMSGVSWNNPVGPRSVGPISELAPSPLETAYQTPSQTIFGGPTAGAPSFEATPGFTPIDTGSVNLGGGYSIGRGPGTTGGSFGLSGPVGSGRGAQSYGADNWGTENFGGWRNDPAAVAAGMVDTGYSNPARGPGYGPGNARGGGWGVPGVTETGIATPNRGPAMNVPGQVGVGFGPTRTGLQGVAQGPLGGRVDHRNMGLLPGSVRPDPLTPQQVALALPGVVGSLRGLTAQEQIALGEAVGGQIDAFNSQNAGLIGDVLNNGIRGSDFSYGNTTGISPSFSSNMNTVGFSDFGAMPSGGGGGGFDWGGAMDSISGGLASAEAAASNAEAGGWGGWF